MEVRARIDTDKCSFYRSRNVARAHAPEVTRIGFYHYMFVWGSIVWRWTGGSFVKEIELRGRMPTRPKTQERKSITNEEAAGIAEGNPPLSLIRLSSANYLRPRWTRERLSPPTFVSRRSPMPCHPERVLARRTYAVGRCHWGRPDLRFWFPLR